MPAWICVTCGVQHADTAQPPAACPICDDERQYVGWDGQRWTTRPSWPATTQRCPRRGEPDLIGVGIDPSFAIGQRALLVRTPQGNVLWDCVSLLDDAARSTKSPTPRGHRRDLPVTSALLRRVRGMGRRVRCPDPHPRPRTRTGSSGPRPESSYSSVRGRARPGPDLGPHRRPFRRRGGAALAGRIRRAGRPAHRRHHYSRARPAGSASCGATPTSSHSTTLPSRRSPTACRVPLRPDLRRLVGADCRGGRTGRHSPLSAALHHPPARTRPPR